MPGRPYEMPLSRRNLHRFSQRGPRYELLEFFAKRDFQYDFDDFVAQAIDTTNLWTVAAGGGATTWAILANAGGWIRGVTGATAATSGLQLSKANKYWAGTNNAGMMVLYRTSSVSEIRLEMGFADALPAVNTSLVNSLATPTFNTVASGALWVFDHAGSTTTSGLYTIGSAASAQKQATTTMRPAAATEHMAMIQIIGTDVYLYTGDSATYVAKATGAITAADGLRPVFSEKKSDTNSANVDIDLIATWGGRLVQTTGY